MLRQLIATIVVLLTGVGMSNVLAVHAAALPAATDLFVLPGEKEVVTVPVQNLSEKSVETSLSLMHVTFEAGSDVPQIGRPATEMSWLSLSAASLTLPPLESLAVTVTATPSQEVAEGSYAFALVATQSLSGAITFAHGTASLLFVTVGSVSPAVVCNSFLPHDDGTFSLTLRNEGQGILYDEGTVALRGWFGMQFDTASSNPAQRRVMPGQTRTWQTDVVSLPWWAFGPVTASFETESLLTPCVPLNAGVRWLPFIPIVVGGGLIGMMIVRRRRT